MNKKHASDTTSKNKHTAHNKLSESELLAREAARARDGIKQTLHDMRHTLTETGGVRAWARSWHWPKAGMMAGAGAALGALALAARAARRRKRAASEPAEAPTLLERLLANEEIAARLNAAAKDEAPAQPLQWQPMAAAMFKTLAGTLESVLVAAVTTHLQNRAAAMQPAADHDDVDDLDDEDDDSHPLAETD